MKQNSSKDLMRKVAFLSAIFFLISVVGCKKDGKLTPDFDDGGLSVSKIDTFSVVTELIKEDSIRTDAAAYKLLGLYNDPIFGPKSSSIYSQILLTGVDVDLGSTTSTFDSIVLTLDYTELYGDTTTPMTINVYELTDDLSTGEEYYSNSYTAHNGILLGSNTIIPNLEDSISLGFNSSKEKAHLRIKLSNTFGQSIMDADSDGTNNQMTDNPTFTNFMKGLYITTADSAGNTALNPGEGSIAIFNLNSSLSTLTMYYNDTSSYSFTINSSAVNYSRFAHNYTGTDIEAHLNNSPTKDTTVSYISTMAGVKTKISLPSITDLTKFGDILINKAELIVTLENNTEGDFDSPLPNISLVGINAEGESFFIPDFYEGLDYYGGTFDENEKTYTFNIARHLHNMIYQNESIEMYLVANSSSISANRSVIGSEKNSNSKIKLNITYSKI